MKSVLLSLREDGFGNWFLTIEDGDKDVTILIGNTQARGLNEAGLMHSKTIRETLAAKIKLEADLLSPLRASILHVHLNEKELRIHLTEKSAQRLTNSLL